MSSELEPDKVVEIVFAQTAERLGQPVSQISADMFLQTTLGMSSLEVVELIHLLNERLQVDALERSTSTDLRTLGDLCKVFTEAVMKQTEAGFSDADSSVLSQTANRARARRNTKAFSRSKI